MRALFFLASFAVSVGASAAYCLRTRRMKCDNDEALVVIGRCRENQVTTDPKQFTVTARPFERISYLKTGPFEVVYKPNSPLISSDGIPLMVELNCRAFVSRDHQTLLRAAKFFTGLSHEQFTVLLSEKVGDFVNETIANTRVSQITKKRNQFSDTVKEECTRKLAGFGIALDTWELNIRRARAE